MGLEDGGGSPPESSSRADRFRNSNLRGSGLNRGTSAPATGGVAVLEAPDKGPEPVTNGSADKKDVPPSSLTPDQENQIKSKLAAQRNGFHELAETGKLSQEALFSTGTNKEFHWQAVTYGKGTRSDSDHAFRGYVMVEPEMMAEALNELHELGTERQANGNSIEFKWLYGKGSDPNVEPGHYEGLQPTDPRIAIYGDSEDEIREILEELASRPKWKEIEDNRNRRYGGVAPRRPGTNAYTANDTHEEYRTLNYNNKPGYSEHEAADPDWRSNKVGSRTQRLAENLDSTEPTTEPEAPHEAVVNERKPAWWQRLGEWWHKSRENQTKRDEKAQAESPEKADTETVDIFADPDPDATAPEQAESAPSKRRNAVEYLSKIPETVKRNVPIFGKNVGELVKLTLKEMVSKDKIKENLFFAGVGAATRVVIGSTGLSGVALSGSIGAVVGGIREHYRQTNAEWLRIKELRQGESLSPEDAAKIRLNLKDTLGGMKNAVARKKVASAAARGFLFGAVGNIGASFLGAVAEAALESDAGQAVQSAVAESGFGQAVGGARAAVKETIISNAAKLNGVQKEIRNVPVVGKAADIVGGFAHEVGKAASEKYGLAGYLQWDKGSYIEPSKFLKNPLRIPDGAPRWLQYDNIHNTTPMEGLYVTEIASAVGEAYYSRADEIFNIATEVAAQKQYQLTEVEIANIMNDAMHTMEVAGNKAFDSNLEQVVNGSQDIADIRRLGRDSMDKWLAVDFNNTIKDRVAEYLDTQAEINKAVSVDTSTFNGAGGVISRQSLFDAVYNGKDDDTAFLKERAPEMAAYLTAYQKDILNSAMIDWLQSHPGQTLENFDFNSLVYPGELDFLLKRIEAGDQEALKKLRDTLKVKLASNLQFKDLSDNGINKLLALVRSWGKSG